MSSTRPIIQIRLFGPVQIVHNDQPVQKLGSQKSLVLLAYLLRHPQQHSRSKLASLLWIDHPPAKARSNLRWALNNLSKLVPNGFQATRQTLQFQPSVAAAHGAPRVDVNTFLTLTGGEASTEQSLALEYANLPAEQAAAQAVTLYRGEFLEGIALDDAPELELWLLQEREFWRRNVVTLLERLIAHARSALQYQRAAAHARQLLAIEAWHEDAHRQLMWLLATAGQRSAALTQFETCCTVLNAELGVEPAAETVSLYEQIRDETLGGAATGTMLNFSAVPAADPSVPAIKTTSAPRHDWGEAPRVEEFYGRAAESTQLTRWLLEEPTQLVLLIGMGGMGKTTFAAHNARQLADHFPHVVWRTLINLPTASTIVHTWVQSLAGQQLLSWPDSFDEQLHMLLRYLQERRCLLVLDNFESILQEQGQAGHYRTGYAAYGQLLSFIGSGEHQSTLLIISREEPYELSRLMAVGGRIERLEMSGLDVNAGRSLLAQRNLSASFAIEIALVMRTSGSPLALKIVAETIRALFRGDIGAFLADNTFVFDNVRDVLEQQFVRLAPLERTILFWLAIAREETALSALQAAVAPPVSKQKFLEAIRSLERRALLVKGPLGFTLQEVVAEHVMSALIAQVSHEIETVKPQLLKTHALCQALTKEYLRSSQRHLILYPILEEVEGKLGHAGLEANLRQLLGTMREAAADELFLPGQGHYGGGNVLNLLIALESDLRGWDFSQLPIWQAHLAQVQLPAVDFRHADFAHTSFTDTFGLVHAVAFHPGGQELAATAEDEIRLWRDPDGQRSGLLRGHTDDVWSIAFNAEGTLLVSGSWDQTVRLWDLSTQKCIRTLAGHAKGVTAVAFSPDAQLIASGSYDHTVCLWATQSGEQLYSLHGHESWVWGVAFSPDGGLVASASADHTIRLWQVRSGEHLATFAGHSDQVWSVAFSPDGRYLASGGNDGLVLLWDMRSHTVVHTLAGHTNWVRSVAFTPDGTLLASGSNDGTIRLWSVAAGQPLQTLHGHGNAVNTVALSQSGRYLASGSNDQSVRIWDLANGQVVRLFSGYTNWIRAVAFSHDGASLISGGDDGSARLWALSAAAGASVPDEPRTLRRFGGHTQMVRSLALHDGGRYLATASADQTVRVWDRTTGETVHRLRAHTNWVSSVDWASTEPQAALLLSGSWDGTICLWDAHSGQLRHTYTEHTQAVYSAIFQPGGTLVASGSGDRTIRLWHRTSGTTVATLTGHTDDVRSLAFSANGQYLVSGGAEGNLCLWALPPTSLSTTATAKTLDKIMLRHTLMAHPRGIRSVAISADGRLVAAGSDDGTISIWSWTTGQRLHHLTSHNAVVWSVAFAPDGQRLASGSSDATVKVWDVTSGRCLQTLTTPGPYAGMQIAGAKGLTRPQRDTLKTLGATEADVPRPARWANAWPNPISP